ncbi:MAG: FixH family protein [Gemmatimonadetes bacterium]|nr:FixH family protein [Gemmatimonadota bacterium]
MSPSPRLRPSPPALLRAAAPLLAWTLAACGAEPPPFDVEVRVSPTPATVGPARVLVEVRGHDGEAVRDARVEVRPVGPEGEAGAGVPAEAGAEGVYVADPVSFPRAGAWTLRVSVTGPAGVRMERDAPIHVVGPPSRDP